MMLTNYNGEFMVRAGRQACRWLAVLALLLSWNCLANLLKNGDFEGASLAPWSCAQQRDARRPLHTLSGTTGYGRQCLSITGDPSCRYNGFIALVQDLPALQADTVYVLSARLRGGVSDAQGKTLQVSVRESDAGDRTIRYVSLTGNVAEDVWKYHEISMKPSRLAAHWQVYVTTSGLSAEDAVLVDDVRFMAEQAAGRPFLPARPAGASGRVTTLAQDGFLAEIDGATGLLRSLEINGLCVHPAAENVSVISVEHDGEEKMLDGRGTPGDSGFVATATYDFAEGMLREVVSVIAEKDFADTVKVSVRHGFDPAGWSRHLDWLRPLRLLPASAPTAFSYGTDFHDLNLGVLDTYQATAYPAVILESPGHYLLVASRNLDDFVTLTPNQPQNYLPSWQRNPKTVKAGDRFRFETNWKLFDRRKTMLRDVCRFYQERLQTSNPVLTGYFPMKYPEPRHFYHGIFGSHTYGLKEREARLPDGANVWFYSMHDTIHESYPVTGEWWSGGNSWAKKVRASELKDYMAYLQNERKFNLIMYLRQLANLREREAGVFPDSWYKRTPGGALHLYGGGYEVRLPEHVARDVGYDRFPLGQHNFLNANFRRHYLKEIFRAMDYYQPRAIGWDMGSDLGEFAVIAETYDRLRKGGHRIRVVANEGAGPTIGYSDMIMLENGLMGGKHPEDFEVVKAFTRSVVCLERWNIFQLAYDAYHDGRKTWLSDHGMASNRRYLDWLYARRPELKPERIESARLCQLRASLYDLALGASPGYLEEARPVPAALMRMAADANGSFGINDSFALVLGDGVRDEADMYASGWQEAGRLRLAVFNDTSAERPAVLRLDKAVFKRLGWTMSSLASADVWAVSAEGEAMQTIQLSESGPQFLFKGVLPPFTGWLIFVDVKS